MMMGKPTYDELIYQNKILVNYAEEHKDGLRKLLQLNSLLDNLSKDPQQNIKIIIHNAKLLLNDATVFYDYFDEEKDEMMIPLPKNSDHFIWKAAVIQQSEKASYIGYPIIASGKTIGVFGIMNKYHRVYSEIEIYIIRMLAITLSLEEDRKNNLQKPEIKNEAVVAKPAPVIEITQPPPVPVENTGKYKKILKECTQSLFMLAKHMNEGLIFVDEYGKIVYANPIFQKITGYSENKILEISLSDILPPMDRQKIADELRTRAASGNTKKPLHAEITGAGEVPIPIEMECFSMQWQNRKVTVISLKKSLTINHASASYSTKIEQTFSTLLDQFPAGVIICDNDANVVYTNKYFYDIMDPVRSSDAISKLYLPPRFSDQLLPSIPNLVEEGVMEITKTIYDETGRERIFRTYRIPIILEKMEPLYGTVVIEITKQIQLEKTLQQDISFFRSESKKYANQYHAIQNNIDSEKEKRSSIQKAFRQDKTQYLSLIKIMPQTVLSLDVNGRIKKIHTFTSMLFGFQRHEVIGRSLLSFVHPDDIEKTSTCLDEFFQSNHNTYEDLSFRVIPKEGDILWFEIRLQSQVGNDGKVELVTGILSDITEKIKLKEQLSKEALMASIGQLSSTLAKEMNLSLKFIENTMNIVHQDYQLDAGVSRKLGLIREALNTIQFKAHYLAKANEEKKENRTPTTINPIIHDALSLLENYLTEQKVQINLDLIKESSKVQASVGELRQVFTNIIFYACELISEDQYLHSEKAKKETMIAIESYYDNHQLVVTFTDNGPGIKKSEIHQVFEHRPEVTGAKKGLAFCYDVVKDHQGIIRVVNNPQSGTSFTIKLPLKGARN